jgi:hypothetical protein
LRIPLASASDTPCRSSVDKLSRQQIPQDRQGHDQQHGKDSSAPDAIHSRTSYSKATLRGQSRSNDLHCFSPLVPLGATAKFRAAAVHGIMTMTRGKGRYALTASVYANVYVKIWRLFGASLSEELTMTKSILAIAILALTTSGALAAHHRHHHQAMNASPVVGAPPLIGAPSPVIWPGAVSSSDHADYVKNLRESGYNPKNDFNANGTVKVQ